MTNKLFKSFFAVVAMLGVALGFTSCETEGDEVAADPKVEVSATSLNFANGEGEQTVNVTSNSNWKVEVANADWLTVTPTSGNGDKTLTVAVAENTTGALREATIKVIALHATYGAWDTKSIKVSQSATDAPTVTEELLYGDNFDGKEATKTYGSGSSWPYIDQFPEFANAEGPASENVTYTGSGVSVRANSTSNSNYSDYAGSGMNNIFFGANAYFQINNIALDTTTASYKLTFGSEKYLMEGDSTFNNEELKVLLSMDGYSWTEIEYTYAGTEPARWNVATADFTLTTVPSNLYIKFVAAVASAYRIDDVKLFTGNGGQEVTLTEGEAPEPAEEGTVAAAIQAADGSTIKVDEATVIAIYNRGFLMEDASGKILVYTNEKATVAIGTKVSVEGTVTTYGGFKQFAAIKGADGNYGAAPTVTTIAEGTFTQPTPKTMDGAAMDAYLLSPKIEYVEYTGVLSISGTYYNVTIEGAQTAIGSISYPIEGTVNAADGQTIVVRGYTIGISSSKYVNTMLVECTAEGEAPNPTPDPTPDPNPGDGTSITFSYADVVAQNSDLTTNGYGSQNVTDESTWITWTANDVTFKGAKVCNANGDNTGYMQMQGNASDAAKMGFIVNTTAIPAKINKIVVKTFNLKYVPNFNLYLGTSANPTENEMQAGAHSDAGVATGAGKLYTTTFNVTGDYTYFKMYNNTTGACYFDSITIYYGESTGDEGGSEQPEQPEQPAEVKKVSVLEFLNAAEDDTIYELTGTIKNVVADKTYYGNFDIVDETGSVYIDGLVDDDNKFGIFETLGLKEGDTITLQTVRTSYNGSAQGKNARYISHTAGSGETPEPTPTPDPNPGDGPSITFSYADVVAQNSDLTTNGYGSQNVTDESTWINWTANDVTFKGAKVCNANGDNTGYMQIQGNASDTAKMGFIVNTTAIPGKITKVVVKTFNLKYEPNFNLYLGTSANPTENEMQAGAHSDAGVSTGAGNLYTTTFDITGDYTFFKMYNNTTGACYFDSMTIYYE